MGSHFLITFIYILKKERNTQGKFQKSELRSLENDLCKCGSTGDDPVSLSSSSQSLCYHCLVQNYCLCGRISSGIGAEDENSSDSEALFLK